MKLLDGKATSAQMKQEMAEEVARIKAAGGKVPHLAAILVGHDGGSETYVANKVKTCGEIGFKSTLIRYEDDVTEEELLRKVDELNNDPDVDGFIVQLPLPKHISEQKIIEAIDYRKDVDGFHPIYRFALLCFGDTCGNLGVVEAQQYRDARQTLRGFRQKQYRRQADGNFDDAEGISGRLYGNGLP